MADVSDLLSEGAWQVRKIGVVGPGIVGMPMAALLANARIREGSSDPARVLVVQRNSPTSGWKVPAINAGKSVIGGIEPDLDAIVANTVAAGLLGASHDYADLADADVILVCVQTDKKGVEPDYGPLLEALGNIARVLRSRPAGQPPLIVIESTLAPSSMATVVRDVFAAAGLVEGQDVLLGNSPNRVMPGRLVERVAASDKIVAGLHPVTPQLIRRLYSRVVTGGTLHRTNSMTAEVVKTLENAYRDVRIAFSAEICRHCDERDYDFYAVRDEVNTRLAQADDASANPNAVPSGGLLVPTVGVGGHCLPKDGILLWWRRIKEPASASSIILASRQVNDASPAETIRLAERSFGAVNGRPVAILGAAYRFNSEDTRNSPSLALARELLGRGCRVAIHDPYVRPRDQNLLRFGLEGHFTTDLSEALAGAELLFFCTAHRPYAEGREALLSLAGSAMGVVDACNLYHRNDFAGGRLGYTGIGRGRQAPPPGFADFVLKAFQAMERGTANELAATIDFLNEHYAHGEFNRVDIEEVRRIAGTCVTGCAIAPTGPVEAVPPYQGFLPRLTQMAAAG